MKPLYNAMFFGNGNTAFFKNGAQMGELQRSWLLLYADFIKAHGIDPLDVVFELPDGKKAWLFETENGYNWQFSPPAKTRP